MKKVVVFGGSGFLGSHIADALTEAKYDVTIFDAKPSAHLREGQKMVIGDMRNQADVEKVVRGAEAVYNFAGIADLQQAHDHPVETVGINVLGNCILLEACVRQDVKRYVFASTIYVYSQAGSFYAASKKACETYIENYQRHRGLDCTILRYGSLYGSRSTDTNIVHKLVRQALLEGCMTYFGDGDETREYVHAEDAARYSVEILAPEFANQSLIIAGHQSITVRKLMEMIAEIIGGTIKLEFNVKDGMEPVNTHYHRTPYSFTPKLGRRLIGRQYIDLGQGLLQLAEEFSADLGTPKLKSH